METNICVGHCLIYLVNVWYIESIQGKGQKTCPGVNSIFPHTWKEGLAM